MADTEVGIYNSALIEIGKPTVALTTDRPDDLNVIYDDRLKQSLAERDWPFADKRRRVSAAGLLDCSAKVITFDDADPDTIADDGDEIVDLGFKAGDIAGVIGSASNNKNYGIFSVETDGTLMTLETFEEVTAEVLTNDTDLKIYARPASRYSFKYALPSDCIRPRAVNEITLNNQSVWDQEGNFIVTNEIDNNDQIILFYTQNVTDVAVFSPLFRRIFVLNLAKGLVTTLNESLESRLARIEELDRKKLEVYAREENIGRPNTERKPTDWQTAGR